jgi:HlyD family secretion protein
MKRVLLTLPLMLSLFACGKKEAERTPIEPAPVNIAVGIGKITPQGGVSKLASPVAGIVSDIAVTTGVKG